MESKKIKHDQQINIKLSQELKDLIDKIVMDNHDIYISNSHFVRCAIIAKVRKEGYKWP
jgi:Arc/MetJ-type ribon-helix-helix transcriptional regulator